MNKKLMLFFLLVLAAVSLSALEFSLRPGGFDPAVWDFSSLASRGYPMLANVGGQ
jgi:hypothetical protein